jgi:hypothetical protein
LARRNKRIRLLTRIYVIRLAQLIAVQLGKPVFVERRGHFGTVQVSDRLTALHTLASVLNVKFVNATADARAHSGELRFRLLHAAKRCDVRLQRGRANLCNLHAGSRDLRWT